MLMMTMMLMKIGIMEMIMKKKRIMIKAMLKMYVAAALWKEPFCRSWRENQKKRQQKSSRRKRGTK